jgi:hypothetical protein
MTNSSWRLVKAMKHESTITANSVTWTGVQFTITRMSFGRRLELARRVREISHRLEFARAGKTTLDNIESALIDGEIDQVCLEWGLAKIEGLEIDGKPAGVKDLIESGPEDLCKEIIEAVKRECGLTESERKN